MKKILFIINCILFFSSCENRDKGAGVNKEEIDVKNLAKQVKENEIIGVVEDTKPENWVSDFKDFRMAIYHQDKAKLKSYFNFPLSNKESDIWYLVRFSNSETSEGDQTIITNDWFDEKDFNKYYRRIFDQKFLKAVLKVKSAELLNKGKTNTEEFEDPSSPFTMYASFDKKLQTLQLNMAFRNNGKDEDGQYVSEGEYNMIYFFDVIEGKKLRFKKMLVAG